MNYTLEQVCSNGFIENVMEQGLDKGFCSLTFSDGTKKKLPMRKLLFNILIWKPYVKLNIPITQEQYVDITSVKSDTLSNIASVQYRDILEKTDVPYMEIITYLWEVVNDVYNFILEYMGPYQQSMSAFSLSKVQCDPIIEELNSVHIDSKQGTYLGEIKLKELTSKLIKAIGTRGTIKDNVLINFMETGSLKANQIPQQMMAYGCRSDIDDHMMKHIINTSAMEGLDSVEDFAIESLSAKKASWFNKTVICDTQYFARVLRLNNLSLFKMYPGHCGSDVTIPITIPEKDVSQYIDKVCFVDGKKVHITEDNMESFKDKRVSLISPLGCRHIDGVCEHCAGRGTSHPWAYMPQVHLGLFSATKVGKAVSQMVLSSKHLIKTTSMVLTLPDCAKKWMYVSGDNIYFKEQKASKVKTMTLRVEVSALHYLLADLEHGVSTAEAFSDVKYIELIDSKGNIDLITVHEEQFIPFFSKQFLQHIKKNLSKVEVTEDDFYLIPLSGFNTKNPILEYVIVNDDMVAFTKRVSSMLETTIDDYTSVTNALSSLTKVIHSKAKINVFFVEILLKSFIRSIDGTGPDIVTDPMNVRFGRMRTNIEYTSVAAKLGHEHLSSKFYFAEAATSVVPKGRSHFDKYFGF